MIVKKRKLKKKSKIALIIIFILAVLTSIFFGIYMYISNSLMKIGYSKEATTNIIKSFKFNYVDNYPNNKTLNAAFESKSLILDNLKYYASVDYEEQEHLIENINKLVSKGYSEEEINLIIARGNDKSVTEFTKKDKLENITKILTYKYSKLDKYDQYVDYIQSTLSDEKTAIIDINLLLNKEDYTDYFDINEYNELMLVNKHHFLGKEFVPDDLVDIPKNYTLNEQGVRSAKVASEAAIKMIEAAKSEGLNLLINSGYRSYKDQEDVYNTYLGLYGEKYCLKYVLKPGYSEHQTGLAFDFASGNSNIFKNSKEFEWIQKNASKYGFIYRFPIDKESITGINNEPWHYRYVGESVAKEIEESKLSFEEYYAMNIDI